MSETRLILHVKGTESETAELPKDVVRTGLSQGKITYSQLIWSPNENAWKQARNGRIFCRSSNSFYMSREPNPRRASSQRTR